MKPRHVLITGAAGKLGKALIKQLVDQGCRLSLCDVNEAGLTALMASPGVQDALVRAAVVDVADSTAMKTFVKGADDCLPIDWVIAAAGITEPPFGPDFAQNNKVFEVNYLGVLQTILPAAARMADRGQGHIVLVSSLSSFLGFPRVPQYAASKAAVRVLGYSLRYWLRREGVTLTIACPGFFESGMSHQGHNRPNAMSAGDVADKIITAALKRREEIIMPRTLGWTLKLMSLLPYRWQDRIFAKYFL
jgi:short-subunit dehydrogenase